MSDTKEMLERAKRRFPPPEGVMDSLVRRRERKERNRRVAAGAVAIAVALVTLASLVRAFDDSDRPADEPTTPDIFAKVHGWIAYGNDAGIWAVDPTHPRDPADQIHVSRHRGEPLAWSSDGSKLLIRRWGREGRPGVGLFVLNSDGTVTRLAQDGFVQGGSFNADASQVVYATSYNTSINPSRSASIYTVGADGGTSQLIAAPHPPSELYAPTFSPDGTQIAYIDGMFDHSHSVWLMNADGTDRHVILEEIEGGFIYHLVWSPDGTHLALDFRHANPDRIYVFGIDGSRLTLLATDALNPHWSPDGTRISYAIHDPGLLAIAAPDGTNVQEFHYGNSGPWNPLAPSVAAGRELAANAGASRAAPFAYAIAVLGVVGIAFLVKRRARVK